MSKTTNIRTLSEIQRDIENCGGDVRRRARLNGEFVATEKHGALLLAATLTHASASEKIKNRENINPNEYARLKQMVIAIEKQFPHLRED